MRGILRRYPSGRVTEIERNAVMQAIEETRTLRAGEDVLKLVDMMYWKRTHTVEGAAMQIHVSATTAINWHRRFLRAVARNYPGMMTEETEKTLTNCAKKP